MVPDGNCGCFTILVLLVLVIVMSVVLVCKKGDTAKDKLEKGLKGELPASVQRPLPIERLDSKMY